MMQTNGNTPPTIDAEVIEVSALAQMERQSIDIQIATAKTYPRDISTVLRRAESLIGEDPELAGQCGYEVPRAGKFIIGPSVRLAEIAVVSWGNLRLEVIMEPVGPTDKVVRVYAMAHDLESNTAIRVPKTRRITNKDGVRYNEDGIVNAQNAGVSIAYRDAAFRIIPAVYIRSLYSKAMGIAAGQEKPLKEMRIEVLKAYADLGVHHERIYHALGVTGPESLSLERIAVLRTIYRRIQQEELDVEQAFPKPAGTILDQAAVDEVLEEKAPEKPKAKKKATKKKAAAKKEAEPPVDPPTAPEGDPPASEDGKPSTPTEPAEAPASSSHIPPSAFENWE